MVHSEVFEVETNEVFLYDDSLFIKLSDDDSGSTHTLCIARLTALGMIYLSTPEKRAFNSLTPVLVWHLDQHNK